MVFELILFFKTLVISIINYQVTLAGGFKQ
ncbi:hypothetical protein CPR19088_GLDEOEPO_00942 [Companilactobacillus paralimentarius]